MSLRKIILYVMLLLMIACRPQSQSQDLLTVEYLTSEPTKTMGLPFSDAVRVGNLLYLSGQIGNIPGKLELVPGGISAETKQTMENIRLILEKNGSSLDRVVKVTVMLADIKEWNEFNAVYITYFSDNLPARSALGANGLAIDARVEIECIATLK
jgi:reactive intermediate/imine deaminase